MKRMQINPRVNVMHVPDTGHTPVFSDRNQNWFIHEWLRDGIDAREWSVLHARLRDDPDKGGAQAPGALAAGRLGEVRARDLEDLPALVASRRETPRSRHCRAACGLRRPAGC